MASGRGAGRVLALMALAVGACGAGSESADTDEASKSTTSEAATVARAQDVSQLDDFERLEPRTYTIDPDGDPETPLRVEYDVRAQGWSQWIGAVKFAGDGHVAVSITTVTNLVRHGCLDHAWADPPIGPSVDDLVTGLAALAPFRVTSAPEDVSKSGHRGRSIEWTVPDLPVEAAGGERSFTGCVDGDLKSWVSAYDTEPGDAFYGYTGPGYVEELSILDVDGTRILIAVGRSRDAPSRDVTEVRAIVDSIRFVV